MPTLLRSGPYRIFVYSSDREEPIHVHVERDANIAKFWLDPVRLQRSGGFSRNELSKIASILRDNEERLIEAWHDYFGK